MTTSFSDKTDEFSWSRTLAFLGSWTSDKATFFHCFSPTFTSKRTVTTSRVFSNNVGCVCTTKQWSVNLLRQAIAFFTSLARSNAKLYLFSHIIKWSFNKYIRNNYPLLTFYQTNHFSNTKHIESIHYIVEYSIYKKRKKGEDSSTKAPSPQKGMKG